MENYKKKSEALEQRIWFICYLHYNVEQFLAIRKMAISYLKNYGKIAESPVLFALIDDSAGADTNIKKLDTLPNVLLIRTEDASSGSDSSFVFGLRLLRGAIREEDIVVTLNIKNLYNENSLHSILQPILEESYDPKKLVITERKPLWQTSAVSGAGFRGWFVQFLLKKEEFNSGYTRGLYKINVAKKIIPEKAHSNSLLRGLAFPLFMVTWTLVLIFFLITPGYALLF